MSTDGDISYDIENDGVDDFLKHFMPDADKQPSEGERHTEEDQHDDPEDHSDPQDAEEPSKGDDTDDERSYAEGDNLFVKIKVGEETHEVKVSDLQRLYGQETALTQKSQQVAAQRKAIEQQEANHLAASGAVLQYARQRWEPYSKIDFLALSRDERISQEQFQALRAEAEDRWNELNFLEQQQGQFVQQLQARQTETMKAAATEAVKQINDESSPYHIPDWSDKTYDSIRSYAINAGMDKGIVNSIVDPSAIKLIHKAMLYDQGASKVKTEKVGNKITKVVKTSQRMAPTQSKGSSPTKAFDRLKQTGNVDDAAAAFLSRWAD